MNAPNTLDLDDDLDSLDLLSEVERVFGVEISDQEVIALVTVGDLYRVVAGKLRGAGGEKCQTSMAFYRIRRALQAVLGDVEIRPSTSLRALWHRSPRSLAEQVQRHCDLRLAPLRPTPIGGLGGLMVVATLFGAPILMIAEVDGGAILALAGCLAAVGVLLIRLDPQAFEPMATVGDLARRTATGNYGALVRLGGRSNPTAIWEALVDVCGAFADPLPPEQIDSSTVILRSQFEKSRRLSSM